MAYTSDNLQHAVSVFYTGKHSQREEAHQWLTSAQSCMEAWSFVWELLQPQKGTEVQFFAATTLHTKLLRCWNELPSGHYEELKDKILQAITLFSNGPKIVLNRLCISLAAYYLQRGGGCNLADLLRPFSDPKWTAVLLEILTVLPEEYNSMTMRTAMRNANRQMLRKAAPEVLQDMRLLLSSVYCDTPISPEDLSLWTAVGGCSASWLALLCSDDISENCSVDFSECLPMCDALLRIVQKIWWCGGSDLACGAGEDAACAALRGVRAASGGGTGTASDDAIGAGGEKYPKAALALATTFSSITVPITQAVNVPNSLHQELLVEIFSTAITLAKTHTRTFTKALIQSSTGEGEKSEAQGGVAVLEMILSCLTSPGYFPVDETHSQLTFDFWYLLQDEVDYLHAAKECTPFLLRLLHALLIKSREPPNEMSLEDKNMFVCYKMDIADAILQLSSVLPWEMCANCATALLLEDDKNDEMTVPVLMALKAMADGAPPNRIPDALGILLAMSPKYAANPNLVEPLLNCLGAYATWLGSISTSGPTVEWCEQALSAAAGALEQWPDSASIALEQLCNACASHTMHIAPVLMQAIHIYIDDAVVVRRLISAAGHCAVAMGEEEGRRFLAPLFAILTKDIHLPETPGITTGNRKTNDINTLRKTGALKACCTLLDSIQEVPSLGLPLVQEICPVIIEGASKPLLTKALFQFMRQCITSLPNDIVPLLPEFIEAANISLSMKPACISIDVSRLIILMFTDDERVKPYAKALFRNLIQSCLTFFSGENLSSQCDVLEEFFVTMTSIIKKKPKYFEFVEDQISNIILLASNCIHLPEKGTMQSDCRWLVALTAARPNDMYPHAPFITARLIHCIGNNATRDKLEVMANVLLALKRAFWKPIDSSSAGLGDWLRESLQQPGYPSPHITEQDKKDFINSIVRNHVGPRFALLSVLDFSSACRGLHGTEYANQYKSHLL